MASRHEVAVSAGDEVTVEKVVTLFTGRDDAITDPALEASVGRDARRVR